MSLIGIDVGTSAIKVGVFAEDGRVLGTASATVVSRPPTQTEAVEVDPAAVWTAVQESLAQLAGQDAVRRDPPRALAISASGDEVFPVDAAGDALGPCLMSADLRGAEIEATTAARASARTWYRECGHVPERMDPVNRILWWREQHPATARRTRQYLGWHEFLTRQLCGRAATDPSLASKWLVFDRATGRWSPERLVEFGLTAADLPEIVRWGRAIGPLRPDLATRFGLPRDLVVGVGAFDSICTTLGLGISQPGMAGLACGTWEVLAAPARVDSIHPAVVRARLPVVEYPGAAPHVVLWQSPNGASVADWAAQLIGQPVATADAAVREVDDLGSLQAIPHLAGSVSFWPRARETRAALVGLSSTTTPREVYAALLDGVASELALAVRALESAGLNLQVLRAGGGGSRSAWWMQRKADLTGRTIEVCAQSEPGAFGAALLAGAAVGAFGSPGEAAAHLARVEQRYEPARDHLRRRARRLTSYQRLVPGVLELQSPEGTPAPGNELAQFETPALVVDLEVFDANVAAAARLCQGTGKTLRPHFKTHQTPALALRQFGPGVQGYTCATVREAEVLVAAGAREVLLANEVVSPRKIDAIVALAERARVIVAIDAWEPAQLLAAAASREETAVEVLVDVEIGLERCGVSGAVAARELALAVARTPGLKFAGLMGYEGRLRASLPDRTERVRQAFACLVAAKSEIERAGLAVNIVSASGTSTLAEALADATVTEVQAGTYALMEPDLASLQLPFQCAVRVVGSVISRRANQVVLDLGRRAVGCDGGLPESIDPRGRTLRVNDEHAVLAWDGELPQLGQQLSLRPTQNRTTFNLHAVVWLCRMGRLVECARVAGRNRGVGGFDSCD